MTILSFPTPSLKRNLIILSVNLMQKNSVFFHYCLLITVTVVHREEGENEE